MVRAALGGVGEEERAVEPRAEAFVVTLSTSCLPWSSLGASFGARGRKNDVEEVRDMCRSDGGVGEGDQLLES